MMLVEHKFGQNDYFVICAVLVSWGIFFFLPKVFSNQLTILIFLYSLTAAGLFDNSFGSEPFDFYDIMDGPAYTVMDIVVYFLYPPFSYLFLYIYKKFQIKDRYLVFFILSFTAVAIGVEWVYHSMGVFHYKNGNSIIYSVCTYLFIQSLLIVFYRFLRPNEQVK
ncbi:hypothetical protein COJ96_18405 [Bacillus sp. AFS073361]|uniref:hypothetical protein n=1 Tax=Bacillus sp. AFS073361 TaxID=2033511 RepID=UPI000BF5C0A9|nr:hypothetical protein [Bacillus sp. AFS073361]PFP25735.1 hypothetical protein COJ96_18405 [Bacillus sp. AFS073361]